MSTENNELNELLNKMKKEQSKVNAEELTKLLSKSNVYVPAVMPQNTDPEILKKMAANPGTPTPVPQGAQPKPCILQNKDGKKFFPIFTSEEEIAKGKNLPKYPLTLNMPFKACMDIMTHTNEVDGAVINPFTQNIVMNVNKNQPQKVKLTEPQLHAVIRQQIESRIFPKKIYDEGAEYIKDLCEREGACMMDLFEAPYAKTNNCPYTADNFEFMILNINEKLRLIRITMPTQKQYPETAISLFVTWNPVEESAGYYAIIKGHKDETNTLFEVTSDGKAVNRGEAPDEGLELQSIIDIATA